MKKEIEVQVTGRVQGVMFRDFTQRKARGLKIVGTVRNIQDGSVRIVAVGEEATLKLLIEKLHQGSLFSRVDSVEVVWRESVHNYSGFAIVY